MRQPFSSLSFSVGQINTENVFFPIRSTGVGNLVKKNKGLRQIGLDKLRMGLSQAMKHVSLQGIGVIRVKIIGICDGEGE